MAISFNKKSHLELHGHHDLARLMHISIQPIHLTFPFETIQRVKKVSADLPSLRDLEFCSSPYNTSPTLSPYHNSTPFFENNSLLKERNLVFISEHNSRVNKDQRWTLSKNQHELLSATLAKTFYPTSEERLELAFKLGVKPRAVQVWFQNRRQDYKLRYGRSPIAPNKRNQLQIKNIPF